MSALNFILATSHRGVVNILDGRRYMVIRELMLHGEVFIRDGHVVESLFSDDRINPEEMRIELHHIEIPEPPRLIADDRPAWQTKYGPARRGRR